MKKRLLSILSLAMLFGVISCAPSTHSSESELNSTTTNNETEVTTSSEENNSSSEVEQSSSENNVTSSDDEIVSTHRATISFAGMTPTGKFNSTKVQSEFVDWFNARTKTPGLLKSVIGDETVETKLGGEDSKYMHLCLGGKTTEGTLTFVFNKDIKEISFGCSAYWKSYTNGKDGSQGFSLDKGTKFEAFAADTSLGQKDLPAVDNEAPEIITISKTLETPCKNFSVKNIVSDNVERNRVFLENITIVW